MVDYSFIKLCFLAFIPQTSYQPLIIPCPNFDPIYQVILLKNPDEWNLFPAKRMILKKERREQGLKSKRGETSYEELHITKKKRMKFTSCWERFYQKKERKEITFLSYPVLCQNHVLIVCMTQDQLFHTYGQKCSQIINCHE
jgi:hypothetical protein